MSSSPTALAAGRLALLGRTEMPVAGAAPQELLEALRQVPDPRDPRGLRYPLVPVLAIAVCAMLAGARSYAAIAEWAADAPPRLRAGPGLPGAVPDLVTIWRVLTSVDPAALDRAIGSWVASRLAPRRRAAGRVVLAVDGKTVRGARAADGAAPHLLACLDHGSGVVIVQAAVDGKTNEVRREAPCRIPNSVRRDSEGSSWARWLTRTRKVMGTKACHEYLRLCPKTGAACREGPRDMAKARLPESQSPVMQVFIHRKWSLKPVPRPAPCYLVGGATSGAAGDAQ
jgi:hypothetical protein